MQFQWLHFPKVSSTHFFAKQNAVALVKCPNQSICKSATDPIQALITCSEQTKGVGRRGNQWQSLKGDLLATFVLKGATSWRRLPIGQVTLAFACALFDAVEPILVNSQSELWIKWPNDLYADGFKVGGVMAEFLKEDEIALASFGVNIPARGHFLCSCHNSLASHALNGSVPNAFQLVKTLAKCLNNQLSHLFFTKKAAFESRHLGKGAARGSNVSFNFRNSLNTRCKGIFMGIDDEGRLIVTCQGKLVHLSLDEICKLVFSTT